MISTRCVHLSFVVMMAPLRGTSTRNGRKPNIQCRERAAYVPVLKLPEVWDAINRYNNYPITVL